MISKLSVRPSDIFMDFLICDRFEKFKRNVGKRKFNFAINIYLNIFFPPPQKYGQWQFLILYILLDELEIFFNLKKKTGYWNIILRSLSSSIRIRRRRELSILRNIWFVSSIICVLMRSTWYWASSIFDPGLINASR